jgi:cytosine/adenosine deaminase-related metal-dependent hydrolase
MTRTLIDGGYVVPMDTPDRVIADGVVAFENERLVHVGPRDRVNRANRQRRILTDWQSERQSTKSSRPRLMG